jgi:hypothetical protein
MTAKRIQLKRTKGWRLPARQSLGEAPGSAFFRIRARDAMIGDEMWTRMMQWEQIKTRFQVTGAQVGNVPCRRYLP